MLDDFRNESDPDPHVVITKVMGLLRPRDVDSRMTIMMNINQLKFQEGETIFDLIPRYNGLVANLPDSEQPDESTKFLHLKMAITSNPKTREAYRNSIETLEIQAADYETVCQALVRKSISLKDVYLNPVEYKSKILQTKPIQLWWSKKETWWQAKEEESASYRVYVPHERKIIRSGHIIVCEKERNNEADLTEYDLLQVW
jgi:hypothetical protein